MKFKIGDKCKIVNYGHIYWVNTNASPKEPLPSDEPYVKEGNIWWFDMLPQHVGKETFITDAYLLQGIPTYRTDVISSVCEEQLELIGRLY